MEVIIDRSQRMVENDFNVKVFIGLGKAAQFCLDNDIQVMYTECVRSIQSTLLSGV